jgi:hypothetical protein
MPAIKTFAARITASLAASAFITPICLAATVVVNGEQPLDIQTPPGFSYVTQGTTGQLAVSTSGYMLCANVYQGTYPGVTEVNFIPHHEAWTFPVVKDLRSVVYGRSVLDVNRGSSGTESSTLVCHGLGSQGDIGTSLNGELLRSGFETMTQEQYTNLINWIPPQGFSWTQPDWTVVPTDPCNPTVQQPAQVDENVSCAAATGARPGISGTQRSPILWTSTDGTSFYYLARVDARFGPPSGIDSPQLPTLSDAAPTGSTGATLKLIDAYDGGSAGGGGGYLGDVGHWCIRADLPSALDSSACSGVIVYDLAGPLDTAISLQPTTTLYTSFYAVFIRPVLGAPPSVNDPAVAVSILLEQPVTDEGGDRFKGDDVAFGFVPASGGFPWMTGQ